jgi:hypothetical protein
VWYARIGKGPRVRIRAEFGTPEFDAEYQAALTTNPRPAKAGTAAGIFAWLIERYRETTAWTDLSLATRCNRENHFKQVIKVAAHQPIRAITQKVIISGRDRRALRLTYDRGLLEIMTLPHEHEKQDRLLNRFVLVLTEELGFPYFIDGGVSMLHDVEPVVDDFALRSPVVDAQAERFPHVEAGRRDAFALRAA